MPGFDRLTATTAADQQLYDPGATRPVHLVVLWFLLGSHRQGDLTAVAELVMRCSKRDLALPLELSADLPLECLLVALLLRRRLRLDAQQEVVHLLHELSKNA